jgi:hypothetical protein
MTDQADDEVAMDAATPAKPVAKAAAAKAAAPKTAAVKEAAAKKTAAKKTAAKKTAAKKTAAKKAPADAVARKAPAKTAGPAPSRPQLERVPEEQAAAAGPVDGQTRPTAWQLLADAGRPRWSRAQVVVALLCCSASDW